MAIMPCGLKDLLKFLSALSYNPVHDRLCSIYPCRDVSSPLSIEGLIRNTTAAISEHIEQAQNYTRDHMADIRNMTAGVAATAERGIDKLILCRNLSNVESVLSSSSVGICRTLSRSLAHPL